MAPHLLHYTVTGFNSGTIALHKLSSFYLFSFPIAAKAQQVVEFSDKDVHVSYTPQIQKCELGSRLAIEDYGDWMMQGCENHVHSPTSYEVWDGKVEEIQKSLTDKRTVSIKETTYAEGIILNQKDSLFTVPADKTAININAAKPTFVNKKEFSNEVVVKETFIDSDNSRSISYYNSNEALNGRIGFQKRTH